MEETHRRACVDSLLALLEREVQLQTKNDNNLHVQQLVQVCGHFVELSCSHAMWSVKAKDDMPAMALLEKTKVLLDLHSKSWSHCQPHDPDHLSWLELRLRVAKQLGGVSRRIHAVDETMKFVYDAMAIEYSLFDVLATDKSSRERLLRHRTSIAMAHMQIADFFASVDEHAASAVNAQHAASMLFEALVVWTKLESAAQDIAVRDHVASKLALALHNYGAELEHLDEASNALQAYRKAYEVSVACFGKDHQGTKTMGRALQSFSMALKEGPLSPTPKKCPSPQLVPPTPHDKQDRWRSSTLWPALLKRLQSHHVDIAIDLSPPKKPQPTKPGPSTKPKPTPVVANPMTSMFAPRNITYAPVLQRDPRALEAPTLPKSPHHQRPATAKSPWNKHVSPFQGHPTTIVTIQSPYDATRPPSSSLPHRPKTAGFVKRAAPGDTTVTCHTRRQPPTIPPSSPQPRMDALCDRTCDATLTLKHDASARATTLSPDDVGLPTPVAKLQANLELAKTIAASDEMQVEPPSSARSKLLAKKEERMRERRRSASAEATRTAPDDEIGSATSCLEAEHASDGANAKGSSNDPPNAEETLAPTAQARLAIVRQQSEHVCNVVVRAAASPDKAAPPLPVTAWPLSQHGEAMDSIVRVAYGAHEAIDVEVQSSARRCLYDPPPLRPSRLDLVRQLSSQVVDHVLRSTSQGKPGPVHSSLLMPGISATSSIDTTHATNTPARPPQLHDDEAMEWQTEPHPATYIEPRDSQYRVEAATDPTASKQVPNLHMDFILNEPVDSLQRNTHPSHDGLRATDYIEDILMDDFSNNHLNLHEGAQPRTVVVPSIRTTPPLPPPEQPDNARTSDYVHAIARQLTDQICQVVMANLAMRSPLVQVPPEDSGPDQSLLRRSSSDDAPHSIEDCHAGEGGEPFVVESPPSASSVNNTALSDESSASSTRSTGSRRRGRRRHRSRSTSTSSSCSSSSSSSESSISSSPSCTERSHVSLGTMSSDSVDLDDSPDDDRADKPSCGPTIVLTSCAPTTSTAQPQSAQPTAMGVDGTTQFPSPTD
ncbi:hypothetical protein H310_05579 [Aphanomyces invadans]|uniref:Uncharacterized protein n=1 Tax=Aphanomyces invadans TaxID=157072 RepID=A0A024UAB6_9STRA|nr:hypothetical protein H310_05579 [Aphanomyces invadans]ETW03160.1 hypothetical protein H310_05579 [Aphanomyces invadans]|eukprot:XP_008868544.1 hypothetical protein H310_05579 [Aphanomyces invadans]